MKWITFSVRVTCLLALAPGIVSGGTLYSVRDADDHLIAIDDVTLNVTDVGPLGVPFEFGGLGYDPNSDTLYMIGGDINKALYRVSRTTGAATLIGTHGVGRLFGLDYDSKNGVLYASQYTGGSGLFTLNTLTGAATRVGDLGGNGFGGLAYDPTSDTLLGMEIAAGNLFSTNRSTAAKSLVFDGPFVDDGGLAFDSDRNLVWHIDFGGNLFSYDAAAGYSRTPALAGLGAHDGLAFVPENSAPVAGKYNGLVQSIGAPAHLSTGSVSLKVTSSGAFSGKVVVGGKRSKFKGTFNTMGAATVTPKGASPPFTLTLQFKASNGAVRITGTVSGGVTANLRAERAIFHKRKNPAPAEFVGRFTALFQATSNATEIPQGDGYATIKVSAGGRVRLAGQLADGSKIAQGTFLSGAGEWPLFSLLYKKQGFVAGFVRFSPTPGVSDLEGTPDWVKPATDGTVHPQPFTTELSLIGSRYAAPPKDTRVLDFADASPNGKFTASDGDLGTPIEQTVTLDKNNKISPFLPDQLKLSIRTADGLVSGSLVASGQTRKLGGVVFQKQNLASGHFLGSSESGLFEIVKSP